jgi:hypothetical protein
VSGVVAIFDRVRIMRQIIVPIQWHRWNQISVSYRNRYHRVRCRETVVKLL